MDEVPGGEEREEAAPAGAGVEDGRGGDSGGGAGREEAGARNGEAAEGGVSLLLPGEACATLVLVGDAVYLAPEQQGECLRLARIVSFSDSGGGKEARVVQYLSTADVDLPPEVNFSQNEVFETDLILDVPVTEVVGRAAIITSRAGEAVDETTLHAGEAHVCSKFIDTATGTVADLVLDRSNGRDLKRAMEPSPAETPAKGTQPGSQEAKRPRTKAAGAELLSAREALGASGHAQGTPPAAQRARPGGGNHSPWPADEITKGNDALFSMLIDIQATTASRAVSKMTLSTAAFQKLGDMGLMQHCLRELLDGQVSREGYTVKQKNSMKGVPLIWLQKPGVQDPTGEAGDGDPIYRRGVLAGTPPNRELQFAPGHLGAWTGSSRQTATLEVRELRQEVASLRQELENQKHSSALQVSRGKPKKLSSRDVTRITKSCLSIMRRELKMALLTNHTGRAAASASPGPNIQAELCTLSETADARHREVMHRHLQLRRDFESFQSDIRSRVKKCEEQCAWAVGTSEGLQDRLQGGVEALVLAQQALKAEISAVLLESLQAFQNLESKIEEMRAATR